MQFQSFSGICEHLENDLTSRVHLTASNARRTRRLAHSVGDRWDLGPTGQSHRGRGGADRRELADGEVSGDETGGYALRATKPI